MKFNQHEELYDKFILKLSEEMKIDKAMVTKSVISISIQNMGLIGSNQPIIIEVTFSTGHVYLVGEDPNFEDGFSYAIKNF